MENKTKYIYIYNRQYISTNVWPNATRTNRHYIYANSALISEYCGTMYDYIDGLQTCAHISTITLSCNIKGKDQL